VVVDDLEKRTGGCTRHHQPSSSASLILVAAGTENWGGRQRKGRFTNKQRKKDTKVKYVMTFPDRSTPSLLRGVNQEI